MAATAANGVFGASGALSRADSYFAIFAARLALKDCWEAPPAAKPQIVGRKWCSAILKNTLSQRKGKTCEAVRVGVKRIKK